MSRQLVGNTFKRISSVYILKRARVELRRPSSLVPSCARDVLSMPVSCFAMPDNVEQFMSLMFSPSKMKIL